MIPVPAIIKLAHNGKNEKAPPRNKIIIKNIPNQHINSKKSISFIII